jgi:hypothetical protein
MNHGTYNSTDGINVPLSLTSQCNVKLLILITYQDLLLFDVLSIHDMEARHGLAAHPNAHWVASPTTKRSLTNTHPSSADMPHIAMHCGSTTPFSLPLVMTRCEAAGSEAERSLFLIQSRTGWIR